MKAGFDPIRAAELRGVHEFRIGDETYVAEVADNGLQIPTRTGTVPLDGDEYAQQRLIDLLLAPFSPRR
ncbi:hypothetical protein [Nonomuraea sp. NPDC049784]|uniref:hypothetical protein n=1 Tax=Nonomuraea sp. NPDC049784 TaxID=3154361 RepID=UPI0033C03E3B